MPSGKLLPRLAPRFALLLLVLTVTAVPLAQQPHDQMNARGQKAMGFDPNATTHRFLLHDDGGSIQVTVKNRRDRKNLGAIRAHLPHIAKMFAAGDFSMPHFIHAGNVPGTDGMKRLRDRIVYRYEDIPNGGRVSITTRHVSALAAIHEFLRYQITAHKTGDPLHPVPKSEP